MRAAGPFPKGRHANQALFFDPYATAVISASIAPWAWGPLYSSPVNSRSQPQIRCNGEDLDVERGAATRRQVVSVLIRRALARHRHAHLGASQSRLGPYSLFTDSSTAVMPCGSPRNASTLAARVSIIRRAQLPESLGARDSGNPRFASAGADHRPCLP